MTTEELQLQVDRETLEEQVGQVWNTKELQEEFEVESFLAPLVFVTRKSDGAGGTLQFDHYPRFYYSFRGDE